MNDSDQLIWRRSREDQYDGSSAVGSHRSKRRSVGANDGPWRLRTQLGHRHELLPPVHVLDRFPQINGRRGSDDLFKFAAETPRQSQHNLFPLFSGTI